MALDITPSNGGAPGSLTEASAYRKATRRLIPFLAICFVVAYLDRVNISFAQSQMKSDLSLSDAAYGLGAGIFFIGYLLFEIPSNLILHRVGAKRWLARIMVTWGILSAAMMFVNNEAVFYLLRLLIGVAEAGFMPGVMLFFTYWFPARKRAQVNSLFLVSVPLSSLVGGPIAGSILTYFDDVAGMPGWQWLFLIEGAMAVLCGILMLFIMTDQPSQAKWLPEDERRIILRNVELERSEKQEHDLRKALRQPETLFLAAVYFFALIGQWGLTFWLPQIIGQSGVDNDLAIGFLSAIPFILACVAMVLMGRNSDRTGERRKHIALCLVTSSVGFVLAGLFAQTTGLAIVGLTLAAVGISSFFPPLWTLPPKALAGPAAAAGVALINSVGNLSGFVSPFMIGQIKQSTGRIDLGLYIVAASVLFAALLVLVALPKKLAGRDDPRKAASRLPLGEDEVPAMPSPEAKAV